MDWVSVISAAICGGVAAAIALVLVRNPKERRGLYAVVTCVLFIGLNSLSRSAVLPRIYEWQANRQVRQMPFYRDLADADPQAYERVRAVVHESIRRGDSKEIIASRIAPIVADSVPRYVGHASDDAVISFAKLMVSEIEELRRARGGACYFFLFPHENGAPSVPNYSDVKH